MDEEPMGIHVESGVSAFSGEPFLTIRTTGGRTGQMTPAELRTMALHWLEAAEAAETDAAVFAELSSLGLDDATAAGFIQALRFRRDPR